MGIIPKAAPNSPPVVNEKLVFGGQICTAPLPPAFMRGVPEGRGEYRTWMQKSFNLEAICPDFWLKRHPGWVGSSPPSVRTGVLRIMVRLPPAIVYYRFAARSTTPRKRGKQGLRPVSLPNTNLRFRTDVCRASFRAAAGADGISLRTETHWPRALPAKHQFVRQNWCGPDLGPRAAGGDGMRRTVTHCHARKKAADCSAAFLRG